ncbi:hypothetical protein Ait01nite_068220 [Actinoplanes italicus]|uniref:Uncharacterized protein n=1 Tax=Actinoplanes italicus TaxID=113567 RepID=A0A2T0K1E3_9ACTN|nr:hypothetical protein [Actinoplanes italicus]PRX16570.1 hypothetical protein CLV67_119151 [Actinoplanes italicus]GIE33777.1 hypothetical protein Ait01nite_068220 [Actinoplanes italicus]
MTPFGIRVARLLERRGAAVTLAEPGDDTLRRLAPVLGLHTADLFVFAGRTLPDDLAPAELTGPWDVESLVAWRAHELDAEGRARLRDFVDGLPARPVRRTTPFPSDGQELTAGTILRRLLANRNLRVRNSLLTELGAGPYMSTATYRMALAERVPLSDDYVNAFARTVGIPVLELAVLIDREVAELPWTGSRPWPRDLVELAWAARRLDDEQLRAAMDHADSLRPRPDTDG